MKTKLIVFVGLMLILAAFVAPVAAVTGNGAISGPHFNLNLIGVKDIATKPAEGEDHTNGGARIFVPLNGRGDIFLTKGPTFEVIDYVANPRAEFMLPAPENIYDPDVQNSAFQAGKYYVFVRTVGPAKGTAVMTTCQQELEDLDDSSRLCSMESVSLGRTKSEAPKFSDVTRTLTTIWADTDGDGAYERSDIFDDALMDYLWQYDNAGVKIVQLRFYPIPA